MDSITLKYAAESKTFDVLYVRGLDDVDDFRLWPRISNKLLDGSLVEKNIGFGRNITIDFGVIPLAADQIWLLNFLIASDKVISCPAEDVPVVLGNTDGVASVWLLDLEFAKSFVIQFQEVSINTGAPAAWM